jgi:hypothetical protein
MFASYFSRLVTPVKEEQESIPFLVHPDAVAEEFLRQELRELRGTVESLMRLKRIPVAGVHCPAMHG